MLSQEPTPPPTVPQYVCDPATRMAFSAGIKDSHIVDGSAPCCFGSPGRIGENGEAQDECTTARATQEGPQAPQQRLNLFRMSSFQISKGVLALPGSCWPTNLACQLAERVERGFPALLLLKVMSAETVALVGMITSRTSTTKSIDI